MCYESVLHNCFTQQFKFKGIVTRALECAILLYKDVTNIKNMLYPSRTVSLFSLVVRPIRIQYILLFVVCSCISKPKEVREETRGVAELITGQVKDLQNVLPNSVFSSFRRSKNMKEILASSKSRKGSMEPLKHELQGVLNARKLDAIFVNRINQ